MGFPSYAPSMSYKTKEEKVGEEREWRRRGERGGGEGDDGQIRNRGLRLSRS